MTSTPLADVELVTFDCFGTLLDWRAGFSRLTAGQGDFAAFLAASELRQRTGTPVLPYRRLLAEAARAAHPGLDAGEVERWALRFGEASAFPEVRPALTRLQGSCRLGVLSNCDALHQLQVVSQLGIAWDVCVTAEQLGAYKPTARAWDAAVAEVEARGFERSRWLHVSAWDDYDLAPARERGIATAWVARPGGLAPPEGSSDLRFPTLTALVDALTSARGGPYVYVVEASCPDAAEAERFVAWMREKHLEELVACRGFTGGDVVRLGETRVRCTYRLRRASDLTRYFAEDAPRLRAEGVALFGATVTFARVDGRVVEAR